MPSVLWRCWLGGRKGIRPVKTEWWGTVTARDGALDHTQIICTSRQTDNHASTSPLSCYRPDAVPAIQPTPSKRWRQFHKKTNKGENSTFANCHHWRRWQKYQCQCLWCCRQDRSHSKSSMGSSDECRPSAGWLPTHSPSHQASVLIKMVMVDVDGSSLGLWAWKLTHFNVPQRSLDVVHKLPKTEIHVQHCGANVWMELKCVSQSHPRLCLGLIDWLT